LILYPTLDEMIGADNPVRLFEELLLSYDWSTWEQEYALHRGQPPIHPRILAGAILYGLGRKIRSSRQLEDACCNRLDYKWLVEGREIDHSTFAKFRSRHKAGLQDLFKHVCRVARQLGHISLEEVATDGTRIQADSSRHRTISGEEAVRWLSVLEFHIDQALHEMEDQDRTEDLQFGSTGSGNKLPQTLRGLKNRHSQLEQAQQAVQAIEDQRKKKHTVHPDKVAKVPLSDPDSRVLKNKEGGFAPNYTPVVTSDGKSGFIVSQGVTNSYAEYPFMKQAISDLEETCGERPTYMMGDGAYTDLETLREVEDKGITILVPVEPTGAAEGDPAYRDDPTTPVAPERLLELPVTKKGQRFTRAAFLFDVSADSFYCPMGKRLSFSCLTSHQRANNRVVQTRVYRGRKEDCSVCPLKERCIPSHHSSRRLERMNHSESLDKVAQWMAKKENRERYNRRKVIAETPFAHIKHAMGIRRFFQRGMEKVQNEFTWICTAYNINKLARILAVEGKLGKLTTTNR